MSWVSKARFGRAAGKSPSALPARRRVVPRSDRAQPGYAIDAGERNLVGGGTTGRRRSTATPRARRPWRARSNLPPRAGRRDATRLASSIGTARRISTTPGRERRYCGAVEAVATSPMTTSNSARRNRRARAQAFSTPRDCCRRPSSPAQGAAPPERTSCRMSSTSMKAARGCIPANATAVDDLPTAGPPVSTSGLGTRPDCPIDGGRYGQFQQGGLFGGVRVAPAQRRSSPSQTTPRCSASSHHPQPVGDRLVRCRPVALNVGFDGAHRPGAYLLDLRQMPHADPRSAEPTLAVTGKTDSSNSRR